MDASSQSGGGLREELRGDATTLADTAKEKLHSGVDARKAIATEGKALARQITAAIDARTGRVLEVREEALGIQ